MNKYIALACLSLLANTVSSQTRGPLRTYKQACNLQQLNHEYAALLQVKRRQFVRNAPAVVFDPALLKDIVEHNRIMEVRNKLFHADPAPCAELVGMSPELRQCRSDPKLLALAIWSAFQTSTKGHCEIQASPEYYSVAVSCSQNYFIVRLQHISVISNEE
ncbi:hypothetical protein [Hymenobacter nivis]|uniref:hypothetical protein n=1 Tax=Hymenobacter nivis TaxID=1850093 RepID=UPI0013A54DB6|nr:hypothetical protein [Hymenobacter nivis]